MFCELKCQLFKWNVDLRKIKELTDLQKYIIYAQGLSNNRFDFKQWSVIHDTTNILIKLIQLKNKIKK